jgi:uncharacterized protein GlcG (DUF336 family)
VITTRAGRHRRSLAPIRSMNRCASAHSVRVDADVRRERETTMTAVTLEDANRVTAAAQAKASELGIGVTVTILDGGGHVRTQSRMDAARFGTLTVSATKAFTAAAFGLPTEVLSGLVQPGAPLFGFADAAGGRIAAFGGGAPLVRGEEVVGAIGVSGGSVDQDQDIAAAGAAAL